MGSQGLTGRTSVRYLRFGTHDEYKRKLDLFPVSRTLYLPVAIVGLYQRPSPVPVDSSTSKAATWEPQVKTCSWCCSTGRMRRPVDPRVAQAHISRVRFKQQLAAEGAVRVGMDFNTPRVRFERFETSHSMRCHSLSIPQEYGSNLKVPVPHCEEE